MVRPDRSYNLAGGDPAEVRSSQPPCIEFGGMTVTSCFKRHKVGEVELTGSTQQ